MRRQLLTAGDRARLLLYPALVACLLLVQPVLTGQYQQRLANLILILAIAALGVNVVMGFAGLVSMAHAAIMAIGAYTSVILAQRYHLTYVLCLVAAAMMAGLVSSLVGVLGTRVKPNYFLVITTGIHYAVLLVLINEAWLTGGGVGIFDVPTPTLGPLRFDTDRSYYLLLVPAIVVALFCADRLRHSRAGRAMVALRQNETAAQMSSINVPKYRVAAMAFAGVYLGAAGSLFAHLVGYLGTESFSLSLTLQLTLVVVVGGIGSSVGAIASVAALTIATEQFKDVGDTWVLWYGVLIMVLMVVAPTGIAGMMASLRALLWRRVGGSPGPTPRPPMVVKALLGGEE